MHADYRDGPRMRTLVATEGKILRHVAYRAATGSFHEYLEPTSPARLVYLASNECLGSPGGVRILRSIGRETCQLPRDTFQTVEVDRWRGNARAMQLLVDGVPERGDVQGVGADDRCQLQP